MKLRTRLTIAFILVVILSVTALSIAVGWATHSFFYGYLDQVNNRRQEAMAELFTSYYERYGDWEGVQYLLNIPGGRGRGQGMGRGRQGLERVIVTDANGVIVADSFGITIGEILPTEERAKGTAIYVNGQKAGTVRVSTVTPPGVLSLENRFTRSVRLAIIFSGLIILLLAALIGHLLASRIANPLNRLTKAVKRLTAGNWKERISLTGDEEIKELVKAFNEMADELEKYEELRRNLVADVAHELRTPLAVLRGQLESLQTGSLEPKPEVIMSLHDEILRLTRLVHDLQELTLAEAKKLPLNIQSFNLIQIVNRVINFFQGEAEEKNISLTLETKVSEIQVKGDKDRLSQVLINLAGNALRYTPQGGKVKVEINKKEKEVIVSVTDSGPGIDEKDLEHIFDRFYRTDKSRNRAYGGVGLGLAIAKGIVEAHGGKIWAESKPNEGSRFTFTLPIN